MIFSSGGLLTVDDDKEIVRKYLRLIYLYFFKSYSLGGLGNPEVMRIIKGESS